MPDPIHILPGCVTEMLPTLPDESVHMVATSPPFYGLRSYPVPPTDWPAVSYAPMPGLPAVEVPAWTGQLGLETTPEAFTGHLVHVFREVWRVLRDDGTAWMNLGSSFARNPAKGVKFQGGNEHVKDRQAEEGLTGPPLPTGIRPKNDLMIPHRVAFALQADGWIIRSGIVWAKGVSFCRTWSGSVMPGSQQDRPTSAYEMVFLMSKQPRYFFDMEAVREKIVDASRIGEVRGDYNHSQREDGKANKISPGAGIMRATRTPRNVWAISPKGDRLTHFAGWPEALVAPMIKAGTSQRGVCPECGSPWERVVERTSMEIKRSGRGDAIGHTNGRIQASGTMTKPPTSKTTGWRATCSCPGAEPVPATVLDPFSGKGTTGVVARKLSRHYIGVEAAEEYVRLHDVTLSQRSLF